MAREYFVPPNTNESEKAVGGVLTFSQFFWLLGGCVLGILVYLVVVLIVRIQLIGIIFGVPVALIGIPFAFGEYFPALKKYKMTFFTYLLRKRKFKKKTKIMINRRNF